MKIRKGDNVKILSGNDRGKQGKVIWSSPATGKIKIEGLNTRKKHLRPRKQGQKGEIVSIPGSIPASRVMIVCPRCSKATRVGFEVGEGDKKIRQCKKCKAEL
jgi:large subunit ribosomal protein L24